MKRLVISGVKQVSLEDVPDEPLSPTAIRIRSLYSGISHGTEMAFYRGTAPNLTHEIDRGLYRERREPALSYPVWHGYETVGEVIEAGPRVNGFRVGDIVWTGNPHADRVVAETTPDKCPIFCIRVPDGADPKAGIFLALAGVAMDRAAEAFAFVDEHPDEAIKVALTF